MVIQDELSSADLPEQILIEALIEFFNDNPGDISGAVQKFGRTRSEIRRLMNEHQEAFLPAKEAELDLLEEAVFSHLMGRKLPDGMKVKSFKLNDAIKVLSVLRPEKWSGKVGHKGYFFQKRNQSSGYARNALERYRQQQRSLSSETSGRGDVPSYVVVRSDRKNEGE